MAVVAGDIEFRLSGGASNADPDASLGGAMSTAEIVNATLENLFDNVSPQEATDGDVEYRCFYITNTNATDTYLSAKVWIESQTSAADTDIEIGLDGAGVGDGSSTGVAVTIANESTAPAGVTFSAPADASAALVIGDVPAGQVQAVWAKRNVTVGAGAASLDDCRIRVQGFTS